MFFSVFGIYFFCKTYDLSKEKGDPSLPSRIDHYGLLFLILYIFVLQDHACLKAAFITPQVIIVYRGVARTVVMCRHCIAPNGGRCGRGSPPSSGGGGSQGPSPRNF